MDGGSLIFTQQEAAEASEVLRLHLKSYMWLAAFYWERRELLFKLRPKTHYMFHVADEISLYRVNPAVSQNFGEESFLGKVKHIGISCHGSTCVKRLFQRYVLCLAQFIAELKKTASQREK